jgi:integrase
MNQKVSIHYNDLEKVAESINDWNIPQATKKDLFKFLDESALGKVNRGKKIQASTQIKYLRVLKCSMEFFNKPLDKVTMKDVESFEKALSSDIIHSKKDTPYTHSVKVDIRLALKVLLRWKLGRDKADALVGWLDTKDVVKTPDYLKEEEIIKLYKACKTARERFLIAVLFDTGARAEEFHNIRFEDIELPTANRNYVKLTLKDEYSKTVGRVISLYWKYSIEAIEDFVRERKYDMKNVEEPVFNITYSAARMFLARLGIRVLKKNVHYHLFRHSSATYYANKLNRQELCYRYGWKFSSNMPDVYISRAGMTNKELDEKFVNTELGELQHKIEKQEQHIKISNENYNALLKELEGIKASLSKQKA